jgi:hypothetical protein
MSADEPAAASGGRPRAGVASRGLEWIVPEWPVPGRVRCLSTTRGGGVSVGPYAGLNLAAHVGDEPERVHRNRERLRVELGLPAEPCWLTQVHGTSVVDAGVGEDAPRADASFTARPGVVCAVLTADCMPVVFALRDGGRVGIAHAGWRGLVAGVLEATLRAMEAPAGEVVAWLGPAIGPRAYEVGTEVREAFVEADRAAAEAFTPTGEGRWLADLYRLARQRLAAAGVSEVWGGEHCTWSDPARFFSFRRDGATGRMATLVWIQQGPPP